ncbi:MAG: exodeoxyribonuclease V subunit gamma, partial [Plesiomonas sp.]
YDEVSGLRAALVGQLAALLETLALWRHTFSREHTPQAWAALLSDFLTQLFVSDTETEPVLVLITRQIERLVEQAALARFDAPLSLAVLRDALSAALDNERISQRFLAGQVNFCTLMPMRSIPFKVVCLLGMNDGVYPRSLPPLGFDLMAGRSRRGDRSRRDDDRYLFLEAILSAQQQLYISYVGRSAQDNTSRAPSVLVSELLDYLLQSRILASDAARMDKVRNDGQKSTSAAQTLLQLYTDAEPHLQAHLVKEQTLTPFSPLNFTQPQHTAQGESRPAENAASFAGQWLPSASRSGTPAPAFWAESWCAEAGALEIELDALRQFYRHPVRAFFRQRLRVSFDAPQTGVPDNEPFGLDGLGRYGINQQLLTILLNQESAEQFFRRLRAEGRLPYGSFGELIWDNLLTDMQALSARIAEERKDPADWEVELSFGSANSPLHLRGWLQGVQDDGLLRWRPGTLNAVDALNLWLEHLVYCLVCAERGIAPGHSRMLGRDETQYAFAPLAAEPAATQLTLLLDGYRQGEQTPLPLLPKTGWAWLSRCYRDGAIAYDDESQQKALRALRDCYLGGYQHNGEGDDPYLQRLFGDLHDDAIEQITAHAARYLLPVMHHLSA